MPSTINSKPILCSLAGRSLNLPGTTLCGGCKLISYRNSSFKTQEYHFKSLQLHVISKLGYYSRDSNLNLKTRIGLLTKVFKMISESHYIFGFWMFGWACPTTRNEDFVQPSSAVYKWSGIYIHLCPKVKNKPISQLCRYTVLDIHNFVWSGHLGKK